MLIQEGIVSLILQINNIYIGKPGEIHQKIIGCSTRREIRRVELIAAVTQSLEEFGF